MPQLTLANYENIARHWHPRNNGATLPSDYSHKSGLQVWMLCSGCKRTTNGVQCGKLHAWPTTPQILTRNHLPQDEYHCPQCREDPGGSKFCECQSVAGDNYLAAEWCDSNPPKHTIALGSDKLYNWMCSTCDNVWDASPLNRRPRGAAPGTGCPKCAARSRKETSHQRNRADKL